MKTDIEYIEELVRIITENGLTEISLEDGEQAITIRKDIPEVVSVPSAPVVSVSPVSTTQEPEKKGNAILAPMVGTFYRSSGEGAAPYVEVGQTISKGDVVCIVEAMKLMNEIESEVSGKIVEICVGNGEPVEYGQVLMYVE